MAKVLGCQVVCYPSVVASVVLATDKRVGMAGWMVGSWPLLAKQRKDPGQPADYGERPRWNGSNGRWVKIKGGDMDRLRLGISSKSRAAAQGRNR